VYLQRVALLDVPRENSSASGSSRNFSTARRIGRAPEIGSAKLAGGIAVISVGAATETEKKEKKARVEDALHATRAAVEEGIVPGGGVALIRAQKALDNLKLEGDEKTGLEIVRRAIESPLRQLVEDAGREGALIVQEAKSRSGNEDYDVTTGEYVDLVKAGVVDPTKVTRRAIAS